jgi:hypothetical protein
MAKIPPNEANIMPPDTGVPTSRRATSDALNTGGNGCSGRCAYCALTNGRYCE